MKYKKVFFLLILSTFISGISAQNIQSPSDFLGYDLGSRFTRHHQVIDYFTYVSNALSNVKLEKYGETNEHRPLYVSYISSQENINNLENIRKENLKQTGLITGNAQSKTAIVWLSYNVHGNEASSTEAAMQTLYELVTKKKDWLKNTLVIMDPCINPDGRDRYVNWYNQVKSTPYNTLQTAKEHNEPWPGGRANHYLFDLNRDWAWATQIESKQRIKIYNTWLPHIHVDFHEQGINNPYYFAPAAEPFHEVITDWQREFQTEIGKNHATYFDKEGWLYFTRESFDLLYPSYGDTYPTFMGAIGMTYEQAGHGRAGLGIETNHRAVLTLKDRIEHHKTTGLSTVEIASKNVIKLNTEFEKFFKNNNHTYKSYVLKNDNQDKINRLKKLLDLHEITYEYATNETIKGYNYQNQQEEKSTISRGDLVVHSNQPKGKMVKVLFEPETKLSDSLTYDITAWSIPYAHGLKTVASKSTVSSSTLTTKTTVLNSVDPSAYAYLTKWNSLEDANFLSALLQENIHVRFTNKTTVLEGKSFYAGSLVVLKLDNQSIKDYATKIVEIANKHERKLTAVATGFSNNGVDLGSYGVLSINQQKVAILSGKDTSSLNFGEIWHFFETELKYPLTLLDTDYFEGLKLAEFDVLIIPEGSYKNILDEDGLKNLNNFAKNGGTIIAIGNALERFADNDTFGLKSKKNIEEDDKKEKDYLIPYGAQERKKVENLITGSVFKSKLDPTHPLAFGYQDSYFSLKLSGTTYQYLEKGTNVAYFAKEATNVSGYVGSQAIKNIPESLLFGVEKIGEGSIIYMADNPLFRSFWEAGKLFFANAIFLVNSDEMRE
jgi:hypothetical protein